MTVFLMYFENDFLAYFFIKCARKKKVIFIFDLICMAERTDSLESLRNSMSTSFNTQFVVSKSKFVYALLM